MFHINIYAYIYVHEIYKCIDKIDRYVYAGFACMWQGYETRKGIMKGKEVLGR